MLREEISALVEPIRLVVVVVVLLAVDVISTSCVGIGGVCYLDSMCLWFLFVVVVWWISCWCPTRYLSSFASFWFVLDFLRALEDDNFNQLRYSSTQISVSPVRRQPTVVYPNEHGVRFKSLSVLTLCEDIVLTA